MKNLSVLHGAKIINGSPQSYHPACESVLKMGGEALLSRKNSVRTCLSWRHPCLFPYRLLTVDPVADSYNGIAVVKFDFTNHPPTRLHLDYFHFGNSCLTLQFAGIKDVFKVFCNGRNLYAEKCSQRLLGQPDRFITAKHLPPTRHRPVPCRAEIPLLVLSPTVSHHSYAISSKELL